MTSRDEIRWTCDRCHTEVMTLASGAQPPLTWKQIQIPTLGLRDLCSGCLVSWRAWWDDITCGATEAANETEPVGAS